MMKRFTFSAVALGSGLLLAAPAFAQNTQNGNAHSKNGTSPQQYSNSAQKQKTQSDPTNTYLFKPESGDYAARPQKQRTDGEDVTGNNNFRPLSK
jgi:hypothetical protein